MNREGGSVVSRSLLFFYIVATVEVVLGSLTYFQVTSSTATHESDNIYLTSGPKTGWPNLRMVRKRALDSTMQTV